MGERKPLVPSLLVLKATQSGQGWALHEGESPGALSLALSIEQSLSTSSHIPLTTPIPVVFLPGSLNGA